MAAKKILVPYDFTQNEIQNAVMQNLGTAPTGPKPGQFYYDTGVGKFFYRNATIWVDPLARANHTGTQLAATISDFSSAVSGVRLDQLAAPTSAVNFNGQLVSNIADGVSAQDAVSYSQLQTILQGRDFKESVRVATTASITQSGLLTIDGITLVAGDRVLDKDNATAALRGIWVAASGAWTRATDFNTSAKVTPSLSTMVEEGTVNQDKQFTLTTNGPIVLGTTALTFAQTGASTTYLPGTGITIVGATVSIDTTVVPRKVSGTIGDGSATSIAVTHGLATVDVIAQVYDATSGALVECDVVRSSTTVTTFNFAVAPAANAYRVIIMG